MSTINETETQKLKSDMDTKYDDLDAGNDGTSTNDSNKNQRASLAALDIQFPKTLPIDSEPIKLPHHLSHLETKHNNDNNIKPNNNNNNNDKMNKIRQIILKGYISNNNNNNNININNLDVQRRHSDGMISSTKLASLEMIKNDDEKINNSIDNDIFLSENSRQVIVPNRDGITKMPFFSTPLTIEATNNAYRDFHKRLTDMGFGEQAEAAIVQTNAESVESAIEFIIKNGDSVLWHRFITNKDDNNENTPIKVTIKEDEPCYACSMPYNKHLIDENGQKIIKKSNKNMFNDDLSDIELELNNNIDDELPNYSDIISTDNIKNDQERQKDEMKKILQNRLKILNNNNSNNNNNNNDTDGDILIKDEEIKEESYKGPKKTCGVCLEDLPESEFFVAPCNHNYCKTCLQSHYKIKTKDGDVLKLSCIDPNCDREILEDEMIHFLTDKELLNKFKKFKRDKLLMLNPNARFCCKPDCDGYMIGSRLRPKLKCPICSTEVCYNCSAQWHGYFVGCNANTDMGYAKWALNKDVQKCPKCRVKIEKADGCNHMTCWSCKHEFCWICKGPYNDAHFAWWNILGCPGGQDTPSFCRCPPCFPSWMNRLIILICFLGIIVPFAFVAAILWLLLLCLVFCVKCEFKCDFDPCNIFD